MGPNQCRKFASEIRAKPPFAPPLGGLLLCSLSADTHNMSDLADRLEVKVIAARDLVEAEGGECNPFAVVKCNMVRVKG